MLFCQSSFSQDHRYSFNDKYDISAPVKLKVYTTDGFIEVKPSTGNFIEVFYIVEKGKNFLKISQAEMDKYYILEVIDKGNLLDISLRRRNENKWEAERDRFNVSCEIFVPVETECDLTSSIGSITISNLKANQKCITIDGNVNISDIHGLVNASTSLGNVRADSICGNVNLTNIKGDIKIVNVVGDISATTSEGDIRIIDCVGSVVGKTTFGDIRCNMNKLIGNMKLVTRNGDIIAEVQEKAGLNMNIKGHELHIPDLDEVEKITENQIFGSVNGGGIPVEMLTTSGAATLSFK